MGYEGTVEPPRPCLLFVHDHGVYLMSNAKDRDLINPTDPKSKAYVVYAEDCNPDIDQDWWDNSRDKVGGDDFVEALPIADDWLELCDKFHAFELRVDSTEITGGFV